MSSSVVSEYYRGKTVFLTGGTGFMGKALVEKLLWSTEVHKIYLLIRPKRGVETSARLADLMNSQLFDRLRNNKPEQLNRVAAIQGDINMELLGISDHDISILSNEVHVLFHSAATVRFDEDLSKAIPMNVTAVQSILNLARKMTKLEALVHVSTAYANCDRYQIDEKIYPAPADPATIIHLSKTMEASDLDSVESTKRLVGARPNAYTFTKALAENLIEKEGEGLPISIVRPSIVSAAWKHPLPGWVDNLNGPTGLIGGALKGVIRSILCKRDLVADMVPVDIPINLMCAVAWSTATRENKDEIKIYNCTSGTLNPFRWRDLEDYGRESMLRFPSYETVWYPAGSLQNNIYLHRFYQFTLGTLPAHLMDTVAKITRNKPVMVRINDKLKKAMAALEYFTQNEWRWSNDEVLQLQQQLSDTDRKIFDFDITKINWRQYVDTYVQGVRKFVFKEADETIPESKLRNTKMYWLHMTVQVLFWFLVSFAILVFAARNRTVSAII